MKLKTTINKQEFFDRLIKNKCRFRKICGIYPTNCRNVKYIGQLKNFKEINVYLLNDKEAEMFKVLFKLFFNGEIRIIKE